MVDAALFSSATGEWSTPQDLFARLDGGWQFTVDAAASHENTKCAHYFTVDGEFQRDGTIQKLSDHDGLSAPTWGGEADYVWVNPPYGRGIGAWVEKAWLQQFRTTVVMLLPARTDTRWFHDYIWNVDLNKPRLGVSLNLLKGRLKFGGAANCAPFPSMVVTFGC